jgi:AraC family transcriptional regulator of adaptative response/methylated-DNA-[protein]-cysteine methyltransferase
VYASTGAELGMTPGAYRRGGKNETIRYATVAVPLGRLLVAATRRGVCAVTLGEDDDDELVRELRREFPAASVERADGELRDLVSAVAGMVSLSAGARTRPDVPLDLRATAFQRRVWDALRRIPAGETWSYARVAAEIGAPGAARAVARACASNRVALVIPCHRVIRSDGSLSGYRWGEERKRTLLEMEAATVSPPRARTSRSAGPSSRPAHTRASLTPPPPF